MSNSVRFAEDEYGESTVGPSHPVRSSLRRSNTHTSNATAGTSDSATLNRLGHAAREANMSVQSSVPESSHSTDGTKTVGTEKPSRNLARATAASDGPSLAAALARSIKHHSKMITGDKATMESLTEVNEYGQLVMYDDLGGEAEGEGATLTKEVEAGVELEAQKTIRREKQNLAPSLRQYVANAAAGGIGGANDRRGTKEDETGNHKLDLTNWFSVEKAMAGSTSQRKSVKFAAEEDAALRAAAIANGAILPEDALRSQSRDNPFSWLPKTSSRTLAFVAPPPTTFRTATLHPSLDTEEGSVTSKKGGGTSGGSKKLSPPAKMTRAAAAALRKRRRRFDFIVVIVVAAACLAASLVFAFFYGEGRFGLIWSTVAYERKVALREGLMSGHGTYKPVIGAQFYPPWWDDERDLPDMEARNVALMPPQLDYHAANTYEPRVPGRTETPFLWMIPRSGCNVIRTLTSRCLQWAEASDLGAGSEDQDFLIVKKLDDGERYVNVDMFTADGIERAKNLNLASTGVPDIIISNNLHEALGVFDSKYRARLFTMLRHPLERAISKYLFDVTTDPSLAGMPLTQYSRSYEDRLENNYLTRILSGRYEGTLKRRDLDVAREFLRRKFVVGLVSDIPTSVEIFDRAFGWNHTVVVAGTSEQASNCFSTMLRSIGDKPPLSVEEGSEGWQLIMAQNFFDIKLYEYAEYMFQLQKERMDSIDDTPPPTGKISSRGAKNRVWFS